MNPRRSAGPRSGLTLIASAGVLGLVGIGLLTTAPQHATPARPAAPLRFTASPAAPQPTRTTATPAPSRSAPSAVPTPGDASASALPPPGSGPAGDPAIQRALDAATPADLPRQVATTLVGLGRQVWTAEATGVGRQRWPGYFPTHGTGANWVYTHFRIQAAIARRDPQATGRAVVRLVWAGTDPTGQFLDDRTATVTFTRQGATWTPLR